jgi:hypothetical protein
VNTLVGKNGVDLLHVSLYRVNMISNLYFCVLFKETRDSAVGPSLDGGKEKKREWQGESKMGKEITEGWEHTCAIPLKAKQIQ